MTKNLPEPAAGTGVPEWVSDLKHIPGALSAVGKLVTGGANAGNAWIDVLTAKGQQNAQAIRDVTEGRSALTKEAVKVAAKQMGKDPELAVRAAERILGINIQKQEAIESVSLKALEYLHEYPPETVPESEPSDDWLNLFGSHAERASSETMQQHWAQILAGEIRKPGTFSFQTLHLASLLDQKLAETIERVARTVCNNNFVILVEGYNNSGENYNELLALDAVGFLLINNSSEDLYFDENGNLELTIADSKITAHWKKNAKASVDGAFLTKAGKEIISIIDPKINNEYAELLIKGLQTPFGNHIILSDEEKSNEESNEETLEDQ